MDMITFGFLITGVRSRPCDREDGRYRRRLRVWKDKSPPKRGVLNMKAEALVDYSRVPQIEPKKSASRKKPNPEPTKICGGQCFGAT
jgi:hypothetical protein